MEVLIALLALTAMEIVLGIDNIVFIAILAGRLPEEQQAKARRLGLGAAMATRLLLLFSLKWILELDQPFLHLTDWGWIASLAERYPDMFGAETVEISVRDLILLAGGLFLVGKSVHEIHLKMEGHEADRAAPKAATFGGVLVQIAILDIVFSLDSVITAVGMVEDLRVMVVAIVVAVGVMLIFAGRISEFIKQHPTLKILALSFLILIGVMLIVEGVAEGINKGYIYFAMAFALTVEFLNIKTKSRRARPAGQGPEVQLTPPSSPSQPKKPSGKNRGKGKRRKRR